MAQLSTLARFEVSGEILSEDTLVLLASPACKISGAEVDEGELVAAYDLLQEQWQVIRSSVAEYDTEKLRKQWLLEVLSILDHSPKYLNAHTSFGANQSIPLTHRSGQIPMWLMGYGESFDQKPEEGRRRRSPHELFQEYLDTTDDEWGVLFNGKTIRLLHDYHKSLTRNYVEADLESIFDSLDLDAFRIVWRIFHASRFAQDNKGETPIAKLRDFSRQDGAAVGKELRFQVRKAIEVLGNGFLSGDNDGILSQALCNDPTAVMGFYQSLLKVVYRILFLLYIENRPNWTPAQNPVWADSYSITRLREMAEEIRFARANGEDLWEGLKVVSRIIREGSEFFGIHPYGGELFDDEKLGLLTDASLPNSDLLAAIRLLTMFERNKQVYRVNFRYLDVEALGSVYEGLLDATAVILPDGRFGFAEGTERKLTGSYYTPKELVAELIKSALVPVIEDRLKDKTDKKEQIDALLSIRVVDPACGSGAFLVQALEKLSEKLVEIRLGGEEPSDLDIREARRDVVRRCIHGVDLNPLAVDLCRFVLWLNVAHPSFPLSYLEPLIKCGNSLVGVPLPAQVKQQKADIEAEKKRLMDLGDYKAAGKIAYVGWNESIPDDAFNPVAGDDAKAAREIKKSNAKQLSGQLGFDTVDTPDTPEALAKQYDELRIASDTTIEAVHHAEELYDDYLSSDDYARRKRLADLWCAAFFWKHGDIGKPAPTNQWLKLARKDLTKIPVSMWEETERLCSRVRFFHWHLEFPDVFRTGGFDCVLGNPPWEMLQLEEQEFFAMRSPDIAGLGGESRKQAIITLMKSNSELALEFIAAKHDAESQNRFLRNGHRFPLTTEGKLNTYGLFAEMALRMLRQNGMNGIIVPTGIATDDGSKTFFAYITDSGTLVSLYDFENRDGIFPDVAPVQKFCLLTLSSAPVVCMDVSFFLTTPNQLGNSIYQFELRSDDVRLLNPNTRTCPVFRTRVDAELTVFVYRIVPVLVDDVTSSNPWGAELRQGLFNMTSDSEMFQKRPAATRLPLYEAKFIQQYDHRHGSYEGISEESRFGTRAGTHTPSLEQKANAAYMIEPRYWISAKEVKHELLGKLHWHFLIAFRDIVRSTCDQRVSVFSAIPVVGVGNTAPLAFLGNAPSSLYGACFIANANSLVFDYITRQKLASTHMNFFVVKQLPFLPPLAYRCEHMLSLIPYLVELVYTAWDIKAFADDVWKDADTDLKQAIEQQWKENQAATGGHKWNPPEWAEIDEDGIPFPPFKWNEERRAVLRAELDAYYARLYGLNRKQLRYILDPHGLSHKELEDILDPWEDPTCSGPHLLPAEPAEDFPGETFRVLKNNDEKAYGEYRTRRLILEAWAKLEAELGPAQPVNYREMLKAMQPEPDSKPKPLIQEDPDDFKLVSQ